MSGDVSQNDWDKYIVNVGVGQHLGAELKVAPDESESGVAVVEHTLPPGKLAAPLHRHLREDDISYIFEGEMGVREDDEVSIVEAEEFAVKNAVSSTRSRIPDPNHFGFWKSLPRVNLPVTLGKWPSYSQRMVRETTRRWTASKNSVMNTGSR